MQLKDSRNFVCYASVDINARLCPTLTDAPLPPFESVEAGDAFPQPSTLSVEQLRSAIGTGFMRMKPSTGGHRCSFVIDADCAAFLDTLAVV
eukprot:4447710-Pyramimonas_sp.AAC.1